VSVKKETTMQRAGSTRRSERGFTLTELLVVIAILGIISGVVVFAVGGIGDRGQSSSCDADKKTVETAQEAYYAKNNAYANNVAALVSARLLKSP
jgi:general secretion pathway protein G